MELALILVVSYVVSYGNFLGCWMVLSFGLILGISIVNSLLLLVSFGGLILISFVMVIPNGISSTVYITGSVIFLSPLVIPVSVTIMIFLLVILLCL